MMLVEGGRLLMLALLSKAPLGLGTWRAQQQLLLTKALAACRAIT